MISIYPIEYVILLVWNTYLGLGRKNAPITRKCASARPRIRWRVSWWPRVHCSRAAGMLWALTGYDLYGMLVVEQHWEPERYETWLAQHLLASASG